MTIPFCKTETAKNIVERLFQRFSKGEYLSNQELRLLAYRDPLTNLPNRRCFEQCLDRRLFQENDLTSFTVLYIDLDRFKKINDTLGHAYGDELLMAAAKRLQACIRQEDVIARIGGDEFVCVLSQLTNKQVAETIAQRMLDAFSKPFFLFEQEVYVTASIGLCLYPYDGETPDTLVHHADMAMYQAKRLGKNQIQWFQAEQQAVDFETFMLENYLRKAVQKGELTLVYQPLLSLDTEKVICVEALLRWNHPEHGMISPQDFIPIAEETGLVIPIGHWVLTEVGRQSQEWQAQGYPPIKIAVNISPRQFLLPNFSERVKKILEETQMDGHMLIIELTENTIIQDLDTAVLTLKNLKTMGINISIDDFGTGYSSLSYLSKLPIDHVKIDRSFIQDVDYNPKSKALTNAMITLAHALEMEVVAEGIETTNQLNEVKNMECDVIQGFLISRPLQPELVTKYFN